MACVSIASTDSSQIGPQYSATVLRHWPACFSLRHSRRFDLISSSAHCPNVLRAASASLAAFFASRGSSPLASIERYSAAFSRASARVTIDAEPKPASRCFPASANMNVQRFDSPLSVFEMVRYKLPPSACRPIFVRVATVRVVSLLSCRAIFRAPICPSSYPSSRHWIASTGFGQFCTQK